MTYFTVIFIDYLVETVIEKCQNTVITFQNMCYHHVTTYKPCVAKPPSPATTVVAMFCV